MLTYQGDTKYVGREMISVAFDIGTTNSAVSYSYLYPDDYLRVRMVTRWPGQPEAVGSSKIPTLLAYQNGQCEACGASALEYVDDSQYNMAKWFKLHLHPSSMKTSSQPPPYASSNGSTAFETLSLPPLVTIRKVYSDFMKYLMENAQSSFEQTVPNGAAIWRRLRETMVVILTTPNGWDFSQQSFLRRAAISAGLVTKETAYDLLEFVTEGEASVHYALAYSQSKAWLKTDSIFAVIDAGGSTVDSTLYECTATDPKVLLEEVCPSECGRGFVDRAAETMLKQKLAGSNYGNDDYVGDMVAAFESRTKRIFDGESANYSVDFGGSRDNDRQNGVIRGKLSLTNAEVASTFEDVIQRTMNSCLTLLRGQKVEYILLVGGLGESAYLQKKLIERFGSQGVAVVTVDEPTKKAAAEGAMIWYIKQSVTARVARVTLGIGVQPPYDPENPEHRARAGLAFLDDDGVTRLPQKFKVLIKRGTKMQSDFTLVHEGYSPFLCSEFGFERLEIRIWTWSGDQIPQWMTDTKGNLLDQMSILCRLEADISGMESSLSPLEGPRGPYYWVRNKVAIRLGGTQLQAKIQWRENGVLREGPVSILPNVLA